MSRALVLLIGLREIAGWRTFWRSGRDSAIAWLGKLLILFLLLGTALGWAVGVWVSLSAVQDQPLQSWLRPTVEDAAHLAPISLLLFLGFACILAALDEPFKFSPAEVSFLVAGPFNRRQLLKYKIGAAFSWILVTAVLATPLLTAVLPLLSTFVGELLLLTFIHLVSLVAGMLGGILGFRGPGGLRRLLITLAVLSFAASAIFWGSSGRWPDDPISLLRQSDRSPGWRMALSPLRWFVEVFLAKRVWPDLVQWSSLCLVTIGILLATIDALDASLERRRDVDGRAEEADARRQAPERVRRAFPLFGPCGGPVPIAWRQAMAMVRKPWQVGFALIMYGVTVCLLFAMVRFPTGLVLLPSLDGRVEINPAGASIVGVLAILLPMTVASGLSFDFRGDMGQIDVLKALPMGPTSVAAGQLFVPVLTVSAMQWLAMAVIAIAMKGVPPGLWVAAAFVPPVSLVLMAIENLPTFWFPLRQVPGSKPEPFEVIGHVLLHPVLRMAGYAAAAVTTLLVAAIAYFLLGRRVPAAVIAAWLTLAAGGVGLVALLGQAFDRFDVTRDAEV